MMIRFECVRKEESDARLILQWRNDPETLRMSYHRAPKSWESFYPEFCDDYFCFPDLPPLFASLDGERVAFLRLRPVQHPQGYQRRCCEVSINVAPSQRGKGVGTQVLKALQPWVLQQGYEDLYAEIKVENAASQKAFEKADFKRLDEAFHEIFDTGEKAPIYRYLATLTPPATKREQVFIIAEVGSNWRMGTPKRDLAMAKALIQAAAEAGADAVKFQTFRPETIYVPNAGMSNYLSEAGIEEEMAEIFADLTMPYEMIPKLAELCKSNGVQFMSSAFSPEDFAAVDPYVSLHKIASYEMGHLHLLTLAAETGKPLLLSTGAATEEEIHWAVHTFYENGGRELTLLQCTACYPAKLGTLHLRSIPWLHNRFKTAVGLSDHSRHPLYAPIAAVALGARVIEKHFTLDNALPGPDHAFAITPGELQEMVAAIRATEQTFRSRSKRESIPLKKELRAFARRGIQALQPIKKGSSSRRRQHRDFAAWLTASRHPSALHCRDRGESSAARYPAGTGPADRRLAMSRSAVFVDLDGTLADTPPSLYALYCDLLRPYGVKGTRSEFRELKTALARDPRF